ncbi:hypothetical protein C0Q70_00031 [Pomacea canaliculata]|uniref:Uncharacterized protein n=1 Tax=Pomacea canaliculata TaxID=400727 RepID=A0A2T7PVJ6_POMCA|nr:hypothetical protein C0Q70_00031 [Pomacea canaliculata]
MPSSRLGALGKQEVTREELARRKRHCDNTGGTYSSPVPAYIEREEGPGVRLYLLTLKREEGPGVRLYPVYIEERGGAVSPERGSYFLGPCLT